MATLKDLSKEQLIELLDMTLSVNEKHLEILKYIMAQIQQKPEHPRGYIDLPIRQVSREVADLMINQSSEQHKIAAKSKDPNVLYSVMKQSIKSDFDTYTI